MNFYDMPYKRVNYEEIEQRYQELTDELQKASCDEECLNVLKKRYRLIEDMTPMELCYVRHDMDVNDSFYAAEQDYYDEIGPKIAELSRQFDRLVLDSSHRDYLEKLFGRQALIMMEESQRSFDSRLISLVQEENSLLNKHNQIVSNMKIFWNGDWIKSSLMGKEFASPERETRKRASLALSEAWEKQREELEVLYDCLVKNRDKQAKVLGFANYVELSYHRMNRIGYGEEEVKCFRNQVKQYLVPLLVQFEERRRIRLGLERLYFYDNGIFFLNGNPKPTGDTEECLEATRKMYTLLSPETAEFIAFLLDNHLYDVEIRDGKRGGGYMTTFEKYRSPFIFANFDGTSENAYIMCHEGGHAFQGYLKRNEEIRERCWYTSEAAETHAMAMEFFTYPYMDLFFGDRAEDYRTAHLEDAVRLIARECEQDEFQQCIYENPEMTLKERDELWVKLEQEYFPGKDNTGNANLQEGCGWQRIPHMYQWPFYAIDYALAEVCALEYYQWMKKDKKGAWESYLNFCRQTGIKNFPDLVQDAGLANPFNEGTMEKLADGLKDTFML